MLNYIIQFLKSKRGIYSITLFLVIVIIIAIRHKAPVTTLPQKEIIVAAKTITPEERIIYLSAYGNTIANSEITIKANSPGKLIKKYQQKGDLVTDGADLFSFTSLEYSTIIKKAELNLLNLEQQYKNLKEDKKSSPKEIFQLKEAIQLAKQKLKNVSSYTNYAIIRAPFAGKIDNIYIQEGDTVKAGDIIAKIIQINPTKVILNIPEKFINDIQLNDQIFLEVFHKQKITATINYISSSIDTNSKTFAIEALIKDEAFPVGSTVIAEIPIKKVLSYKVSRSALTIDRNNNLGILYLDHENKAQFLASEVVEDNQENLWIRCNSTNPLKIIVNGSGFVVPGTKVKSQEEND